MKKYLDFIGSALLCCFTMPMYLFVSNYPQFGLVDTLLLVATFLGIFACIAMLPWFVFRDIDKVSFWMYGAGILFWFSYPLGLFLIRWLPRFITSAGYIWLWLIVFCLIGVICLGFFVKYFSTLIKGANGFLSLFTFLTLAMLLSEGCWKICSDSKSITSGNSSRSVSNGKQYPNVYHILLDAHPNLKAMEIIGGDLRPFYRELERLGFVIFPESRSNYWCTDLSVTSMLNMNYLSNEVYTICNNKVFNKFKKHNYKVLLCTDNRMVSALYAKEDGCFFSKSSSLMLQLYTLIVKTPVKHIYGKMFKNYFKSSCKQAVDGCFQTLEQCKDIYGSHNNVFYTHILCPHEPCIFSKEAENRAYRGFFLKYDISHLRSKETHQAYCENVYGVDVFALKCIKKILQQYKTEAMKPVIVLHSDHSILNCAKDDLENPFVTADTVYGNLLALYVPEEWKRDAKDLTFINLYRWIFNHLFGENYPYFKENKQVK